MNRQCQITDSRNARRRVLETEHRVKQRMSAYITRDVQVFNKPFKWIILMRKGIQNLLAHTCEQAVKSLILLHFAANSERINEHSDNALCIRMMSAR